MKKFRFIIIGCCLSWSTLLGQQLVALESFVSKSDTSVEIKSLSLISENVSQKKGFKELFENENAAGPKLNPRAVSFVSNFIEKNSKDLIEMKSWGKPYFNVMDAILISHKLPKELKYLAVIESRLHNNAVSWVGAVGPWQLMPGTARLLGLKVTRKFDERTNYVKSTHAAARYLNDLYDQFGDWLLVIAAYNGGPGNVLKAIRKSGSTSFWDLQNYLPAETRNHVKKFIGTHYVFEGQGGLTTITKKETDDNYANGLYTFNRKLTDEELGSSKTQTVSGKYYSMIIAKNVMMNVIDFNRFNPDFDKVMASANNSYEIRLPVEKMDLFNANRYQILNDSIQFLISNASAVSVTQLSKDTIVGSNLAKQ